MVKHSTRRIVIFFATVVLMDFVSKWLARIYLVEYTELRFTGGHIAYYFIENKGMALSIMEDYAMHYINWVVVINMIAVVATSVLVYHLTCLGDQFKLPTTLFMAGALANCLERLASGGVTDFILFRFHNYTSPVFNIADIAISVAGIMIAYLVTKSNLGPLTLPNLALRTKFTHRTGFDWKNLIVIGRM